MSEQGYVRASGGDLVLETRLSAADETSGRIIVVGHDLFEAAARLPYEEVAGLLWSEILPGAATRATIGAARAEAFARFAPVLDGLGASRLTPVERQRLLLAALPGAELTQPLLVAATGVAAAIVARLAGGGAPLPPDPALGHAADLLRMARGRAADGAEERALNIYLSVMIDHGVNASTLAARVVASTGAGLAAAAVAALSALEGALHGGAPGLVLDMLDEAAAAGDVDAWLDGVLAGKRRLMGFGSRAYGGRDPRAAIFKDAVSALPAERRPRLAFAEQVETQAEAAFLRRRPERPLRANVEFYAALLLEALGLPRESFTAVFAAGRSAGWAAHVTEQARHGRMLRPGTRYCGPSAA